MFNAASRLPLISWGLRNYGTNPQFWGGDKNCEHEWQTTAPRRVRTDKDVKNPTTIQNANKGSNCNLPTTLTCSKCNGWLGELGLEPTPEMFVEHLVIIFEEVKRVLKKDGTIWVNIADSYQASSGAELEDIKPKDMIGVPWLLALALRNAGWYLRQDIIWAKKNTMPESVQDRCTRSHEYIFLLSKNRNYYYDNKAVTNQAVGSEPDANLRDVWHMNSAEGYKDKDGVHHACVDEITECLTTNGWKRYDEISIGDKIATYDVNTRKASWGILNDLYISKASQNAMCIFKTRTLDMVLTPDHRVLIENRFGKQTVKLANEVKVVDMIPLSAEWDLSNDETIGESLATLLGWYIADGHECKYSSCIEIYQSKASNPEKVDEIEQLLVFVQAEYKKAIYQREWRGRDSTMVTFRVSGYVAHKLREIAPQKLLHSGMLLWNKKELESIQRALILGDGNYHKDSDGRVFIQKNKQNVEMFQAICVLLGQSAAITPRAGGTSAVYVNKRGRRSLRGKNGINKTPYIVQTIYTKVWCPSVDSGFWLARRNGKVFITGNTFPYELPERCIKLATKPGDVVLDIFNGSGTTGLVALHNKRLYLGCELSPKYIEMTKERFEGGNLPLLGEMNEM